MASFLGLKYPILKSPQGYLSKCTDTSTIKSDLLMLLMTNFGERVMLPSYGTNLSSALFEPNNATTQILVNDLINNAIRTWEPRVRIDQLTVTSGISSDPNTLSNNHLLTITIRFSQFDDLNDVDELVLQIPIGA